MTRNLTFVAYCALALSVLAGCDRTTEDESACKPSLVKLAPTPAKNYDVNAGQIVTFHAEPQACEEGTNYNIRWKLNGEVVGYSNDYDFIACNEDAGDHELYAEAITYAATDTASVEQVVASHQWTVKVKDVTKPTQPSCYAESIRIIQNTKSSADAGDAKKLQDAVACLDAYLETYACDFKASYASGLAKAALFAESFYPYYQKRAELTVQDVQDIVDKQVTPIRKNFLVVAQKAPADFSFTVDGRFKIFAFRDDPNLSGNDTIFFEAYGRHDKGEASFILTIMNYFDGFLSVGLANQGIIEFLLHMPDNETPMSASERLISQVESDPRFLTFDDGLDENGAARNDGSGAQGRRLMGLAQNSFIEALKQTNGMLTRVFSETHDQSNDLLRYWDCGKDAICPATCSYMGSVYFNASKLPDPPEHNFASCEQADGNYDDNNLNGKCDEGYVKPDAGECNQKYDEGEALGTERIGFGSQTHGERIGPSTDLPVVMKVLQMVQDNVRGPDYLDLDKVAETAGLGVGIVSNGLKGFMLPYPMIRISEFFVTPTQFRDLLPLYDKRTKQFIIDLESEPFLDAGYDWVLSENETGYHAVNNIDPNFDDFDIYCNPDCNDNDRFPADHPTWANVPIDNDGDGISNGADNGFLPKDLGVEGNFVFDFIDKKDSNGNFNGVHDIGEVSEKFDDVGTVNAAGKKIGAGDKKWTKADRAHEAPSGANIGPVSSLSLPKDPPNGLLLEQPDGLYDYYYYFFQDPTFSGTVHFVGDIKKPEEKMESANGEPLTDSALLHRFMNRALELAAEVDIREANAHECQAAVYEDCNHWSSTNPSQGYQP